MDVGEMPASVYPLSPHALDALIHAMRSLPAALTDDVARGEALKLHAAFRADAARVALAVQNTLLQAGEDEAAMRMLTILTAIWDLEDLAA